MPLQTANQRANADVRRLLNYFAALPQRPSRRLVSGQHIGFSPMLCESGNGVENFRDHVEEVHEATGRWIAMIGGDYGCNPRNVKPFHDLTPLNDLLIDWWRAGGLVTVCFHAPNPFIPEASAWLHNHWIGQDYPAHNLRNLITPGRPGYDLWRQYLERCAAGLTRLRDAGVVVIWRPFHEMTGGWFWWGREAFGDDPEAFKDLWRDMFVTFSDEFDLDNLLWNYTASNAPSLAQDACYPGEEFADMVGQDLYDDDAQISGYEALCRLGKPVNLGEFGPGRPGLNGAMEPYDYRRMLRALKEDFPQVIAWKSWVSSLSRKKDRIRFSLRDNEGAADVLNDPWVITRDTLDWRNH